MLDACLMVHGSWLGRARAGWKAKRGPWCGRAGGGGFGRPPGAAKKQKTKTNPNFWSTNRKFGHFLI